MSKDSNQHSGLHDEPIQGANEATPITPDRRIEGLRNLREGYDLVAAVGFWKELHGEDLIEEYAGLVEQLEAAQAWKSSGTLGKWVGGLQDENARLKEQEREGRRLLFDARFKLSEMLGFVREVRPDLTAWLAEIEMLRDDIADYLRITREAQNTEKSPDEDDPFLPIGHPTC